MATIVKWDQCFSKLFRLRKKVLHCDRTLLFCLF